MPDQNEQLGFDEIARQILQEGGIIPLDIAPEVPQNIIVDNNQNVGFLDEGVLPELRVPNPDPILIPRHREFNPAIARNDDAVYWASGILGNPYKKPKREDPELERLREECLIQGYDIGDTRICPDKIYIQTLRSWWKWDVTNYYREGSSVVTVPKPDLDLLVRKRVWQNLDYKIGDKRKILEVDLELSYRWAWELMDVETKTARGIKKTTKPKVTPVKLELLKEFLSTEEKEFRKGIEELDSDEEAIVNINELAQHYATIELSINPSFVIEDNCEAFEKCCNKHLEIIKKYKRNTDG